MFSFKESMWHRAQEANLMLQYREFAISNKVKQNDTGEYLFIYWSQQ